MSQLKPCQSFFQATKFQKEPIWGHKGPDRVGQSCLENSDRDFSGFFKH